MNKSFNAMRGGYEVALGNLRRHHLRLYGTFIFGYDADTPDSFCRSVEFAAAHRLYIAAFNHLTPFPGTPLYTRLSTENRLLFERWWLDDHYKYNMVPFRPASMSAEALQRHCLDARRTFYSWPSITRRAFDPVKLIVREETGIIRLAAVNETDREVRLPIECGRSRPTVRRSNLAGWASYGYCASHSRWLGGLRLHLVTTPAYRARLT